MCPSGTSMPPQQRRTELRKAFDLLDADRDGKIGKEDLKAFYSATRPVAEAAEEDLIRTMISVADSNGDGYVEFEEFERVLNLTNSTTTTRTSINNEGGGGGILEEAFRLMDKDGDGRLSAADLKAFLNCAGLFTSDEDIIAMIALGGDDGVEGLSFDALLEILAIKIA
ncbi:hypothetical protein Ancab_012975 [Ancistrocladus abbreviatus]